MTTWFLISDNMVSDFWQHGFWFLTTWFLIFWQNGFWFPTTLSLIHKNMTLIYYCHGYAFFWNNFSPNLVVVKQKHFPRHDLRLSAKTEMILNQKDSHVKFSEQFLFLDKLLCCEWINSGITSMFIVSNCRYCSPVFFNKQLCRT